MGSAFTPVHPRRASPMPTDLDMLKPGDNRRSRAPRTSKRTRQTSSLHTMMMMPVEEEDEDDEVKTMETIPDHLSTSASEGADSSRGSIGSSNSAAPPLLDFIGNTCMASAWFTSCFPCAVVDINDSDDYVVDKLSRESAMNVMYGNNVAAARAAAAANNNSFEQQSQDSGNVMYVSLPPNTEDAEDSTTAPPAPTHTVPSVIQEEESCNDDSDDAKMEDISLEEGQHSSSQKMGLAAPVTPTAHTRQDSGIIDYSRVATSSIPQLQPAAAAAAAANGDEMPINSPPKKKRFGMKKLFGRKK